MGIMGQIVQAMLGWCEAWAEMATVVVVFVWTAGTMFLYFNSQQFGVVGFLLAVFGIKGMVADCRSPSDPIVFQSTEIVNVVLALAVMVIVDSLLASSRGSDLAVTAYKKAWDAIYDSTKTLFDPDTNKTEASVNEKLFDLINLADSLGKEASNEPRYWRCEWRAAQYADAIAAAHKLRNCVSAMMLLVADGFEDGNDKNNTFQKLCKLEAFEKIPELLLVKQEDLKKVGKVFEHELSGIPDELNDDSLTTKQIIKRAQEAIVVFIKQAGSLKLTTSGKFEDEDTTGPASPKTTSRERVWLENEFSCQVSVILVSIKTMLEELRALQIALMKT